MGLKTKYTSPKVELLDKFKIGSETRILKMEIIETSKVKNHYIYECEYVEKKNIHQTYIIAVDIEDAISRLSEMVKIPSANTRHFILGNETLYLGDDEKR